MILPNVKTSFGRPEAAWLIRLLAGPDENLRREWEEVLADQGIDALLDDPRTTDAILAEKGILVAPTPLVLYVLIRRAFLERGIGSRMLADYTTALVFEFGKQGRSFKINDADDKEYHYLVDILDDLSNSAGRRAFLLRAHLGNFALWLSGLFPGYIVARRHRHGGPNLDYYEEMGQTGYRLAAADPHLGDQTLGRLYQDAADTFGALRRALNHFSDRHLLPTPTSPVDRLLRQVADDYRARLEG